MALLFPGPISFSLCHLILALGRVNWGLLWHGYGVSDSFAPRVSEQWISSAVFTLILPFSVDVSGLWRKERSNEDVLRSSFSQSFARSGLAPASSQTSFLISPCRSLFSFWANNYAISRAQAKLSTLARCTQAMPDQVQHARHARFDESRRTYLLNHCTAQADKLVQCDESKPICQRCRKPPRICLGTAVARKACFSIHVENPFTSGKLKRPRGPRSSMTAFRPHFDLETWALAYYLKYYLKVLTDGPNVSGGILECVAAWIVFGRTSSMVDSALSSIALAVFSRAQNDAAATLEATSRYCRLLQISQTETAAISQFEG